jgi:hypothetical protein
MNVRVGAVRVVQPAIAPRVFLCTGIPVTPSRLLCGVCAVVSPPFTHTHNDMPCCPSRPLHVFHGRDWTEWVRQVESHGRHLVRAWGQDKGPARHTTQGLFLTVLTPCAAILSLPRLFSLACPCIARPSTASSGAAAHLLRSPFPLSFMMGEGREGRRARDRERVASSSSCRRARVSSRRVHCRRDATSVALFSPRLTSRSPRPAACPPRHIGAPRIWCMDQGARSTWRALERP